MDIKKGIRFHNSASQNESVVYVNSGVQHHSDLVPPSVKYRDIEFIPEYEKCAFIPKRDWRKITDRQLRLMEAGNERNDSNTIYLGELPQKLIKLFKKINIEDCENREAVFAKFRDFPELTKEINKELDEFLSQRSLKEYNFHYLGVNFPNLEMVASDTTKLPRGFSPKDQVFVGMHNDGTKYVHPSRLHTLGNRLTINLGKEPRYFVFINLTINQALNMLRTKIDVVREKVDIVNIRHHFFKHFPDYPVIRITQRPHQYYIAPTDNCFHDGSTLGMRNLDIIMVYFGAFKN